MTGLRRFRLFAFQFFWYNLRRKEELASAVMAELEEYAQYTAEALKESVSEKLYAQEPLAQAILSYLNNSDPAAHQAILNRFDEIVSARIDCLIQEALENEANTEKCRK